MSATGVGPASADQAEFLAELIERGLLLESGVPGIYGHSAEFEDVRSGLDALLTREASTRGAVRLRFPPVLPRRQLEASGYLASFPHLAGTIYAFEGSESQAAQQSERAGRHEDWGEFQQMTELALMPAACYPVYPAIAAQGRLAPGGVFVDAGGAWVFRHEPSNDPARRQMFHQHELVRIAEPEAVLRVARRVGAARARALARPGPRRESSTTPTTRSSGGAGGCSPQTSARSASSSSCWCRSRDPSRRRSRRSTTIASTSARTYGIELADGGTAHTACLGFGHERIVLALLRTHGLDTGVVARRGQAQAVGLMSMSKAIGVHSLSGSDPAGYQRHLLHGDDRTYVESNCYSDVIIELLHACGYEPLAAFGHLVRMDFEGDQWTFFKPPPEDLESLFGVDIHEMQPYRPLPEQIAEQLRMRTHDHRRARLLVPARHRVDELPLRARQELDRRGRDRLGRADVALLPRPRPVRARRRRLPRRVPDRRVLRRRAAPVHRARPLRRRAATGGRGSAPSRRGAAAPPSANSARARTRSTGSVNSSSRSCPRCSTAGSSATTPTRLRPCAWPGRRSRSSSDHARWLLDDRAQPAVDAMREIVDGCKALSFRLARRRQFDSAPLTGALADAWARAIDGLLEAAA